MADFDLTQTDAQVQSILNDAQDAQGAGAQTTLTTDYIMLKGTNGRYHKIQKESFTEAVRNTLASLLVNNDKGTTISQIAAIASEDFGSITPANLASVLGVACVVGPIAADEKINNNDDLNQLTLRASYRCQFASISKTVVNMPETASTNFGFSVINIKPYGDPTAFETQIFIQLDGIWIRSVNNMSTPYTWTEWKKIAVTNV